MDRETTAPQQLLERQQPAGSRVDKELGHLVLLGIHLNKTRACNTPAQEPRHLHTLMVFFFFNCQFT